jgi:hypothetical protein
MDYLAKVSKGLEAAYEQHDWAFTYQIDLQAERIQALEADRDRLREALASFTKSAYIRQQHPKRYAAACAALAQSKEQS